MPEVHVRGSAWLGRWFAAAFGALCLAACGEGVADVRETAYLDHDMGESYAGLTVGEAGGCDGNIVRGLGNQLVAELNCIQPNLMVNYTGSHVRQSSGVMPYLSPGAANALKSATTAANDYMTINSAYRTVAEQALFIRWFNQGRCGFTAVAQPGQSNHNGGRALDVQAYAFWKPYLQNTGWSWLGSHDPWHYDHFSSPNLASRSVLAFQRLWNKNNPDKLVEDGIWGPASASAMNRSPASGFPKFGCAPAMQTGVLKGVVYELNAGNPSDTTKVLAGAKVSVNGKTLTTDGGGVYEVTLNTGSYTVSVTLAGYKAGSVTRAVTANATVWGSVGLEKLPPGDTTAPSIVVDTPAPNASSDGAKLTVTGSVTDGMSPVSSLTLKLNDRAAENVTLSSGAFSHLVTLRAGANTLVLTARDAAGNTSEASLSATFRAGVTGRVFQPANTDVPRAGIQVTVRDDAANLLASASSGSDGAFEVDIEPAPASARVRFEAEGFITLEKTVAATDTQRAVVEVGLSEGEGLFVDQEPSLTFESIAPQVTDGRLRLTLAVANFAATQVRVNHLDAEAGSDGRYVVHVPLDAIATELVAEAFDADGRILRERTTVGGWKPDGDDGVDGLPGTGEGSGHLEGARSGCSSASAGPSALALLALAAAARGGLLGLSRRRRRRSTSEAR